MRDHLLGKEFHRELEKNGRFIEEIRILGRSDIKRAREKTRNKQEYDMVLVSVFFGISVKGDAFTPNELDFLREISNETMLFFLYLGIPM